MGSYCVPNGYNSVNFQIPEGIDITVVKTNRVPPVNDPAFAIRQAILNPIGSTRLAEQVKPGQKVAIIATDITRKLPEDIILSILVEELERGGIDDKDITIIVATGTHRPNTQEEFTAMFGRETVFRIRVVNHNAWDQGGLINLGKSKNGIPLTVNRQVAEADLRISTGVIEPHLFAGYSGGVKSLAVGVAGEATIAATHNYEMMKNTRLGVIENNPFRDFLTEATMTVGLDFVVNVIQTGEGELVRVVAGEPVQAFREGVSTARTMFEVEIERPADIIIAGVSYPKNRDLYQATRAANPSVFGPRPVVKKGGVILIPASCEDGFGHPGYLDWMKRCKSPAAIIQHAREFGFAPGDQKALILGWILEQARIVITDCDLDPAKLRAIHLEVAPTLQEALEAELSRRADAHVLIIPEGIFCLPIVKENREEKQ